MKLLSAGCIGCAQLQVIHVSRCMIAVEYVSGKTCTDVSLSLPLAVDLGHLLLTFKRLDDG